MVFCGKPSKSCEECRLRRTKCDRARPSCSQCIRARRVCKGYRDVGDLMFRDESKKLVAKARIQSSRRPARSRISPLRRQTISDQLIPATLLEIQSYPSIEVPTGLRETVEQQATSFFFQNYVPDKTSLPGGGFQYLEDIFGLERVGGGLLDIILSLGISGLASFWKEPGWIANANTKYASSSKTISLELESFDGIRSNQVFAAVMLLGLYKVAPCSGQKSMEGCAEHTSGSSAIMKLRGKKQLKTSLGYQMFIHHRAQVIKGCVQMSTCVPSYIAEWNDSLDEGPLEQVATALSQLHIKYANIQGEMGPSHNFSNPESTIIRARNLDAECVAWTQNRDIQYISQTRQLSKATDESYLGHYDMYPSLWVAMIWNSYRTLRIQIHDLILLQVKHFCQTHVLEVLFGDPNYYEKQIMESESLILQLSREICSSVSAILGSNASPHMLPRPPRLYNGNMVLWPLYYAGFSSVIPRSQLEWIIGRLQHLLTTFGLRQAIPLLYGLCTGNCVQKWDGQHVAHLPSDEDAFVTPELSRTTTQEAEQQQAQGYTTLIQNVAHHNADFAYVNPGESAHSPHQLPTLRSSAMDESQRHINCTSSNFNLESETITARQPETQVQGYGIGLTPEDPRYYGGTRGMGVIMGSGLFETEW
ncbi:hypothetical protein BJ875DRAFT_178176 [Amylocarpus encephaloides]|uniref:Zn(2)-C6 fungal-type domain-containing protein n=1 Tax=Amylocarpus encephaloides TaxID=45428 RepID=A0A9P7YQ45_9HELO|nr:hypothetical protein BJ875DRAFT_178176 [Amylocarpus encephaloides]